jgi:hypothetical protein
VEVRELIARPFVSAPTVPRRLLDPDTAGGRIEDLAGAVKFSPRRIIPAHEFT